MFAVWFFFFHTSCYLLKKCGAIGCELQEQEICHCGACRTVEFYTVYLTLFGGHVGSPYLGCQQLISFLNSAVFLTRNTSGCVNKQSDQQ